MFDYDIAIAGGGLVGATLACALADSSLRIALVDAKTLSEVSQSNYDERTIALALASKRMFEGLDLWERLEMAATPIDRIHVSEAGRFGMTRMHSADEGVEALGYVIANRELAAGLYDRIRQLKNISILAPKAIKRLAPGASGVRLGMDDGAGNNGQEIKVKLVIGADGGASTIRQLADIKASTHSYGQSAIVCNITPGRDHDNVAYERFTPAGPLALLPMNQRRCAVVWTQQDSDVNDILQLDDETFLHRLQTRFGHRLGKFKRVGVRQAYPLSLVRAHNLVSDRVALVGNAAHSLHPVGGQGFNLAFRDVAVLAQLLNDADTKKQDIGNPALLYQFAEWRQQDFNRTIRFTDGLVRIFTNPIFPLAHLRSMGLLALDIIPALRHILVRQAMGFTGRVPRLAVGLPPEPHE